MKRAIFGFTMLLGLLLVVLLRVETNACCPGHSAPKPKEESKEVKKEAFAEVTLAELKELVKEKKVVLLDANGTESYKKGHIPGALDVAALGKGLAAKLPQEKDALIVAYCGGPKCGAWKGAAGIAAKLGYTNVKHFAGGLSGWKEDGGELEAEKTE
jgi:rhodanese-related sulfurtransferase